MSTDEELRIKAKKRAEAKIGFYWHIGAYAVINIFLFLIWFYTGQGFPWFLFVLGFWGIGVLAHYLTLNYREGSFTEGLAEKEYEKLKKEND